MKTTDKPAKQTHCVKSDLDWPAIMANVRAGTRSYTDIGAQYGVSKGRISQKAKELGVTRDLAPAIAARAAEIVAQGGTVNVVNAIEADVVEVNAETQARIIIAEREDVKDARALLRTLQARLKEAIKPGKGKAVARKVKELPDHIDMARKLVETIKSAMALERSVHNIEADTPIDPAKRIAEAVDNGFIGLRAAFTARLARK